MIISRINISLQSTVRCTWGGAEGAGIVTPRHKQGQNWTNHNISSELYVLCLGVKGDAAYTKPELNRYWYFGQNIMCVWPCGVPE